MNPPTIDSDEPIDLRKLMDEARRQQWIESGKQAEMDKMIYDALVAVIESEK